MKVKRMGITEILRKIWLFSANKIKSFDSFSKQSTQPRTATEMDGTLHTDFRKSETSRDIKKIF